MILEVKIIKKLSPKRIWKYLVFGLAGIGTALLPDSRIGLNIKYNSPADEIKHELRNKLKAATSPLLIEKQENLNRLYYEHVTGMDRAGFYICNFIILKRHIALSLYRKL